MKMVGWVVALALLAACGAGGNSSAGPVVGAGFCPGGVAIMLRGANVEPFEHFFVTAPSLAVTGGGAPLPVVLEPADPIDLVAPNHAFVVGTAAIPEGAASLVATLPLGTVQANLPGGSALLDLCTAPLRIAFSAGQVDPGRCHVVVHLDLARSVGAQGSGHAFLPNFTVQF